MIERTVATPSLATRRLPLLLLLFVGSGCAALIYEIVWFQLLELVIGSSAVSLGVLLGTFMGGMCLGSLLLPRSSRRASIRCASTRCSSSASALSACWSSSGMPLVGGVYTAVGGIGVGRHALPRRHRRASACCRRRCLMGATLPAIARWVETTPQGVSWLGFFYGGNIAGAVRRQPARRLLSAARARQSRWRRSSPSRSTSLVAALALALCQADAAIEARAAALERERRPWHRADRSRSSTSRSRCRG